jgi:hypothetical protein
MTAVTEGFATTQSEVRGHAVSRMRGTSRGTSDGAGQAEVFINTIAWLPSATYSLEEQLNRFAGELAALPRRECFVKIENERPFRTRTADLTPPFRTGLFKRIMLPHYLATIRARSPYLISASQVDAALRQRSQEWLAQPADEDFTAPEPIPPGDPVHDAVGYAAGFWKRKETPKEPPGRPPKGDLSPEHERFRVLDGGKAPDRDGDNEP